MSQNASSRCQKRRPNIKTTEESPVLNSTERKANENLIERCWERADLYVKQFIEDQDKAANNLITRETVTFRNFVQKLKKETNNKRCKTIENTLANIGKSQIQKTEDKSGNQNDQEGNPSKEFLVANEPREQSETELSQVSQSTTDESKTYSQVYSEIYEESRARQEKAELIGRVYTNKRSKRQEERNQHFSRYMSRDRTERWVRNLGQPDIGEYTETEASNESDRDSQSYQPSLDDNPFTDEDYKYLLKEQLDVIALYQNYPFGGFQRHIEEHLNEMAENDAKAKKTTNNYQPPENTKDTLQKSRDGQSEANRSKLNSEDIKNSSQLEFSRTSPNPKCLLKCEHEKTHTVVLQFEHCDVYQVKKPDKSTCYSKEPQKSPTESLSTGRSGKSCQGISNQVDYGERKHRERYTDFSDESEVSISRVSLKSAVQQRPQKIQNMKTLDESKEREEKYYAEVKIETENCPMRTSESEANTSQGSSLKESEEWNFQRTKNERSLETQKSQRQVSDTGEKSKSGTSEQKSRRIKHQVDKSDSSSNNRHQVFHTSSNSTSRSKRYPKDCNTIAFDSSSEYINEADSIDDYYLSSKSVTAVSSPFGSTRSLIAEPKTYKDRASSPIQILSSDVVKVSNQTIDMEATVKDVEDDEDAASMTSTKSELLKQRSQVSIISKDKGVQYPSGNELDESEKNSLSVNKTVPQVGKKEPSGFKDNKIIFDNEDKSLDTSSSDDRKKDGNGNSSNSPPSGERGSGSDCSIFSICSYEPSERFYRRTQPFDDGDINPLDEDNDEDSEPLSYRQHVARLAERALRVCSNYCHKGSQLKSDHDLELDQNQEQDISDKVLMLYNSELQFQTPERLQKRDELLQQLNQQLQQKLKLIAPRFQ